jgi:hypothetical protein
MVSMRVTAVKGLLAALLALGVLLTAGARDARAGDENAVAIMPLDIVGNVPAGRPALEAAVARGLAVLSGPTVNAAEAAGKLTGAGLKLPCRDGACWSAAGRALGARYLVTGVVERKGPMFAVQFRLVDAPSGRLLATEKNECEVADCSVAELSRQVVRELARQTLGTPPPAVRPATNVAAATPPPPDAPLAPGASSSLAAQGEGRARVPRFVPVAAIAAGALALGAGAYYLERDGDCRDPDITVYPPGGAERRDCSRVEDTKWAGLGFAAGGAALVTTGVVLLVRSWRDQPEAGTQISVGPGGVLLSGRF